MPTLEAIGLEKRYGRVQALIDVGLRVEGGQIAGLVGPNGAGKTTTMRAILGLVRCERGVVRVDGTPVTGVVRADVIGALVDRPSVYPYLSGRGNLEVAALALFGRVFNHDLLVGYLDRLGLGEIADRPVCSYSTGERQRLGLAMSLIGDPRILVLDEPMSGLDPAGIVELRKMLRELGSEGRAILLSSHLLHEVERVCDVVTVVDGGRVISAGHPSSLAQGPMDLLVSSPAPRNGRWRSLSWVRTASRSTRAGRRSSSGPPPVVPERCPNSLAALPCTPPNSDPPIEGSKRRIWG